MTPDHLTELISHCVPGTFADQANSRQALAPLLDAGLALVPLAPMSENKEPYGQLATHGVNSASTDPTTWDGWLSHAFSARTDLSVPALGVGLRVGRIIVVDADTAEQAATAREFLSAMGYPADAGPTVSSPGTLDGRHDGRGGHWYILAPETFMVPSMRGGKLLLNSTINVTADGTLVSSEVGSGPGATCAIKLYGSYVCIPGTQRPAGNYTLVGKVHHMTEQLENHLLGAAAGERTRRESVEKARAERRASHGEGTTDAREGARERLESGGWSPVLSAAGWAETGGDRCGCATWQRPGGTSPRSATAHYLCAEQGGSTRLQVWTDALADMDIHPRTAYSMEYVAAKLHYGGSLSKLYTAYGAPSQPSRPVTVLDPDAASLQTGPVPTGFSGFTGFPAQNRPSGAITSTDGSGTLQGTPAAHNTADVQQEPETVPSGTPATVQDNAEVPSEPKVDDFADADPDAPWNRVPATLDELTGDEAEVFNSTELTKTLWRIARGNGASPWALLGGVMLRTLGYVGPHVMLENIDGPYASLNMSALYIGMSGAGKSKIGNTIATSVRFRQRSGNPASMPMLSSKNLGSGEGIAQAFCGPTKKRNRLRDEAAEADGRDPEEEDRQLAEDRLLFQADEAANTEALGARSGATLLSKIISAITGGDLGNTNASEETTRSVPSNSYRFCLEMNAQPSATGFLIEKSDLGLPQRFLWLDANGRRSMTRPSATERNLLADITLPAALATRVNPPSDSGFHVPGAGDARILVTFPDTVADYIWAQNTRRQHGCGDGQDSHRNLTRMKLAAGFALLDGAHVTEQRTVSTSVRHWDLAGVLLEHSDAVRRQCHDAVKNHAVDEARDKLETTRDAESELDNKRQEELTQEIERAAADVGTMGVTIAGRRETGGLAQRFSGRTRKWKREMCPALLALMVNSGKLVSDQEGRYYLPQYAPPAPPPVRLALSPVTQLQVVPSAFGGHPPNTPA